MRKALLSTVAALAIVAPFSLSAAEVDQAGAEKLQQTLTQYLPKDVVDTGFLKVTPATNRYELSVDFQPLLKNVNPTDFVINGLKPFVHYLTPNDDGTWRVEANQNLDVNGTLTASGKKQAFTYKIDKMIFDGMFDPTISYFTTGKYKLDKIQLSTGGDDSNVVMSADSLSSDLTGTKVGDNAVDIASTLAMNNIKQTVSDKNAGDFVMSATSMTGSVQAKRLATKALRDLIIFGLDVSKTNPDTLDKAQSDQLKVLLKANVPLTDDLAEEIRFDGVSLNGQGMDMSIGSVTYGFGFTGITKDASARFTFAMTDPKPPAGILPPGTEGAVPTETKFGVAITNLDLEGVALFAIDNADFTKPEPWTPEQSAQIEKIILPTGKMNIEFYGVMAKSPVYDLSLKGSMLVDPNDSDKPEADITLTAKDIDKTVKYLQDNAQTVPEFGQASFMLLMMKGFGKADGDTMVWNVKLDKNGDISVNGTPFKM